MQEFDPEGNDPALHRMVVIGHSQGGLLTKLTAIDSGTRLWDNIGDKPFEEIIANPETRALLRRSVFFTPLPFVQRVIFIATPHRGALMAGSFSAGCGRARHAPGHARPPVRRAATASGDEKLPALLRRPPTAVDNMSPSAIPIQTLASIRFDPDIPAHSIIPVKGTGRTRRERRRRRLPERPHRRGRLRAGRALEPLRPGPPRGDRGSPPHPPRAPATPEALARDLSDHQRALVVIAFGLMKTSSPPASGALQRFFST